jgi:hypothetical protein
MNQLDELRGKHLVERITSEWVIELHNELSGLDLANTTKNNRWQVWSTFLDHLDTIGRIVKPKILSKLGFSRTVVDQKQPWTLAEWREEIGKANGPKRLALLLAANCGFYASDIVTCFAHYDAGSGTITMARDKTKRTNGAVRYVLWEETVELMNLHGPELAKMYKRMMKWEFQTPMKQLRHTTKSFIMNGPKSQFCNYMTGVAPKTDTEKFYWTRCEAEIREAYAHLRKRYGLPLS